MEEYHKIKSLYERIPSTKKLVEENLQMKQ